MAELCAQESGGSPSKSPLSPSGFAPLLPRQQSPASRSPCCLSQGTRQGFCSAQAPDGFCPALHRLLHHRGNFTVNTINHNAAPSPMPNTVLGCNLCKNAEIGFLDETSHKLQAHTQQLYSRNRAAREIFANSLTFLLTLSGFSFSCSHSVVALENAFLKV